MQRYLLIGLIVLILLATFGIMGGGAVLATSSPLHTGQAFYRFQYAAELILSIINSDPDQRAERYLSLVDRRLGDLAFVTGTDQEIVALAYLNADLDRATRAAQAANSRPVDRIQQVVDNFQAGLDGLLVMPDQYPKLYIALQDKLATLRILVGNRQMSRGDLSRIELIGLPYPADILPVLKFIQVFNPSAVPHTFPLVGQHALQECGTCHKDATYIGLSTECQSCHGQVKPQNHYEGDCLSCHSPIVWGKVHFDHELVMATDCMSCHLERRPANHFQLQCSFCHTTRTFKGARPDHKLAGATDCISCHQSIQPKNHFDRQCSDCHVTAGWKDMSGFQPRQSKHPGVHSLSRKNQTGWAYEYRPGAVFGMSQPKRLETARKNGPCGARLSSGLY